MIQQRYNVYFEIFGKKLKAGISATSEQDAKQQVMNRIKFYKVEPVNPTLDRLKDIFGMK